MQSSLYVSFLLTAACQLASGDSTKVLERTAASMTDQRVEDVASEDSEDENIAKLERSPLYAQPKFLPFLADAILKPSFSPGPINVGLGIGLGHHGIPITKPSRPGNKPECTLGYNYCLYDHRYPIDKINAIVDRYYNDVDHLYTHLYHISPNDLLYYENRTDGYRTGGHFVCESRVEYVRPGWARNVRGDWLAVINTDKFPQKIRTETCKYGEKRCEYLPPCYRSRCVQRYTYIKLLCADPYRPSYKPVVDVFEIPVACSCFVENFVYYK